jgi:hypothetical protein
MEARVIRAMGIIWIWTQSPKKCVMSNCYDAEEKGYQRMKEEEILFCKYPRDKIELGFQTEYYIEGLDYKIIF